jgi:hypothetical protein
VVSVLDRDVYEILERVEAEAAAGDATADRILDQLLAELDETGELGVVGRLTTMRYFATDGRG